MALNTSAVTNDCTEEEAASCRISDLYRGVSSEKEREMDYRHGGRRVREERFEGGMDF
jgi:hypothetical protein